MRALLAALPLLLLATAAAAACRDDQVMIRGDFGQARFTVEIADDPEEQRRGLMFRESLPMSAGMLFVYDDPQRAVFWMENTLIPLDMIFIGPDGRVTHIHENAIPLDRTSIDGGTGVLAVLEINGGLSARYGLEVGDEIQHPAFDPEEAAWPCP